jgi:hypothetical protein
MDEIESARIFIAGAREQLALAKGELGGAEEKKPYSQAFHKGGFNIEMARYALEEARRNGSSCQVGELELEVDALEKEMKGVMGRFCIVQKPIPEEGVTFKHSKSGNNVGKDSREYAVLAAQYRWGLI